MVCSGPHTSARPLAMLRPRPRCGICWLGAAGHTCPHTSARLLAMLAPRPRCACPAGKLHSAAAPRRTPCRLCRRNGSFPAVQPIRWGAARPGNKGVQAFVHTVTVISCAAGVIISQGTQRISCLTQLYMDPAYSRPGAKLSCEPQGAFRPFRLTCGQRQKTAM